MGARLKYEFKDNNELPHIVTIYDDTYSGALVEAVAGAEPFTLEYPETEMFDPIKGAGATLSFIYYGDESFMRDWFTADIKRFTVEHRIDGAVHWVGFLNSELYQEDYSSDGLMLGIQYSLTANDGLSILDRLDCFNGDSQNTITMASGIKFPLTKTACELGYAINTIYIYIGIESSQGIDDMYNNLLMNVSNYVDEDGVWSTSRVVLRTILEPFGLFALKEGSVLYIQSIESIARYNSITYRLFFSQDGANTGNDNVVIDTRSFTATPVLSDDYFNTGQTLSIRTGINKQKIVTDTYVDPQLLPNKLSEIPLFTGDPVRTVMSTGEWGWNKTVFPSHEHYTFSNGAEPVIVTTDENQKVDSESTEPISLITGMQHVTSNATINGTVAPYAITTLTKKIIPTSRNSNVPSNISLSIEGLIQHTSTEYLKAFTQTANSIDGLYLGFEVGGYLKIGDMYLKGEVELKSDGTNYWNYINVSWTTTPSTFPIIFTKSLTEYEDQSNGNEWSNDRWIKCFDYIDKFGFLVQPLDVDGIMRLPVPPSLSELDEISVEFGISNYYAHRYMEYRYKTTYGNILMIAHKSKLEAMYGVMIRNVEILIGDGLDVTENEIEATDYSGYKDSGSDINLMLGTGNPTSIIQRGAMFMQDSLGNVWPVNNRVSSHWFRRLGDDPDNLEELLLDSVMENLGSPAYEVSLELDYPKFKPLTPLSLPDISNNKFLFSGGTINYRDGSISGKWTEIKGI